MGGSITGGNVNAAPKPTSSTIQKQRKSFSRPVGR